MTESTIEEEQVEACDVCGDEPAYECGHTNILCEWCNSQCAACRLEGMVD